MSGFSDIVADMDAVLTGPAMAGEAVLFRPRAGADVTAVAAVFDENSELLDGLGNVVEYRDVVTFAVSAFQPRRDDRLQRLASGQWYRFRARAGGDGQLEQWTVVKC